jgi:hypothetical protein
MVTQILPASDGVCEGIATVVNGRGAVLTTVDGESVVTHGGVNRNLIALANQKIVSGLGIMAEIS